MTKQTRFVVATIQMNQALNNYSYIYYLYKSGQIDENLWNEFCLACFETLMEDNQEVLKRLKNI